MVKFGDDVTILFFTIRLFHGIAKRHVFLVCVSNCFSHLQNIKARINRKSKNSQTCDGTGIIKVQEWRVTRQGGGILWRKNPLCKPLSSICYMPKPSKYALKSLKYLTISFEFIDLSMLTTLSEKGESWKIFTSLSKINSFIDTWINGNFARF